VQKDHGGTVTCNIESKPDVATINKPVLRGDGIWHRHNPKR